MVSPKMKVVFVLCGGEAPNSRAPKFMSRHGSVLRTQESFAFGCDFSRSGNAAEFHRLS